MTLYGARHNMWCKIVVLLTCFVIGFKCISPPCEGCRSIDGNLRVKRSKYFSSPPQRFYRRPPMSTHGAFSYTPPPSYKMDNEEQPTNYKLSRYGKRPINDGLGEEDLQNLMKYLSKKDLDRIAEFAVEKDKYRVAPVGKPTHIKSEYNEDYRDNEQVQPFSINGPYVKPDIYSQPQMNYPHQTFNSVLEYKSIHQPIKENFDGPFDAEATMNSKQFAVLDGYIQQEINGMGGKQDLNIFTDEKVMKEEQLPAPVNLRNDDFDAAFTNNVPAIANPNTNSYKVENFGDLPLMDYNSKLHTVSSYNVPHYTITTPNKYQPAPEPSTVTSPVEEANQLLEPAPPAISYRDQSDAHLKATKIWTHKSRGTAYYLHTDGSLSLERPSRPKPKYG